MTGIPGFAARHPEAFTRLPDDTTDLRRQLDELRARVDAVSNVAARHFSGYLAEHGHSSEQIDAALRGEETGAPVGVRKALKSFKR